MFIPDPGSRMLTFYPSRIPDTGVKKAPDPGSGSATLLVGTVPAAPLLIILSLLLLLAGLQVLLVAGEVGQEALDAAHAHLHQPGALDTGVQPSTRHLG